MTISKSDFMTYLRHPAWLWYKKHAKNKLPQDDANLSAILEEGNVFEEYAQQRFPDGLRLGFTDYDEYHELLQATKDVLAQDVQTIFQGRFEADGLTCITDVLDRVDDTTFDLYEIKASTRVKPEHELDLAFQLVVLEACGYTIRNISVIHVAKDCVRHGELDGGTFTRVSDVTVKVRARQNLVRQAIASAQEMLTSLTPPDISPRHAGLGCMQEWLGIYRTLNPNLPDYTIYDLCSVSAETIRELEDMHVLLMTDIPDGYKLTIKQQRQVTAIRTNQRYIDKDSIASFMQRLQYPLYFLDYETLGGLIPQFDGMCPYEQTPFQYSVHIVDAPGAVPQHREYLHRTDDCPANTIVRRLMQDIGEDGTILVWNESFEKMCNRGLARMVPTAEGFLHNLNDRIIDLMLPFANGWVVDKDFCGSSSIKKVLPVLVPELSYAELDIHEGASAQRLWMEAVLRDNLVIDKEKLFADLIEYCGLDTLAMVKIYDYLIELCGLTAAVGPGEHIDSVDEFMTVA